MTNITLVNSELVILNDGTLTITGNGANALTIDGGAGSNRIFYINDATVTITGVTLTGGDGSGAAIYSFAGNLTLDSVVVRDNLGSGSGGAVFLGTGGSGTYSISNSAISGNQDNDCAGFRLDDGTLTVTNSTVSGNQATGGVGGGFCVLGGALTLRNATVTGNSAPTSGGGGLYLQGGTLNFGNSIVAGNTGGDFPEILNTGGTITSRLQPSATEFDSTNTELAIGYQSTDIRDTDPLLGPLALFSNSRTPTHALLDGSPAIDQGHSFGITTDQRDRLRPVNIATLPDAVGGDGSDIGAFEKSLGPTNAIVTVGGRITSPKGNGISGARVTLSDPSGGTRAVITNSFGYFRISNVRAGHSYIFSAFSKRHSFEPDTIVRSILDDTDDIYFVATRLFVLNRSGPTIGVLTQNRLKNFAAGSINPNFVASFRTSKMSGARMNGHRRSGLGSLGFGRTGRW